MSAPIEQKTSGGETLYKTDNTADKNLPELYEMYDKLQKAEDITKVLIHHFFGKTFSKYKKKNIFNSFTHPKSLILMTKKMLD